MSSPSAIHQDPIRFAAELIRKAKRTVVLTGAGISTPSGIPDFRSEDSGLWTKVDPEVASLNAFRYHPEKFYQWIRPLAGHIFAAQPNPAHLALARLENAGYIQTVITQNIDLLHQKAGSRNVLETHGSLKTFTCTACFRKFNGTPFIEPFIRDGAIPHCTSCEVILKPDVILFGEQLPVQTWNDALSASRTCDLMFVAGSSLEVLPVAGLPLQALDRGAHLIIVNHYPTYLGVRADIVILDDVATVIPAISEVVLDA